MINLKEHIKSIVREILNEIKILNINSDQVNSLSKKFSNGKLVPIVKKYGFFSRNPRVKFPEWLDSLDKKTLQKLFIELSNEEENLDEDGSTSGGAGAYSTPYAFGKSRKVVPSGWKVAKRPKSSKVVDYRKFENIKVIHKKDI